MKSTVRIASVGLLLLFWFVVAGAAQSQAQTYSVLHRFQAIEGSHPSGGLVQDSAGNLYGVTADGGSTGHGTAFKLSSGGETVLHNFGGGADGIIPVSGLTLDAAGNLYGITFMGGNLGVGTAFRLDSAGNETVLYSFNFGNDGAFPDSRLIRDSAGNLYGITASGGAHHGANSGGTIFRLDPNNNEAILFNFRRQHTGLIADGAGNFYGTTISQFTSRGRIFKLDKTGKKTVLYRFAGGRRRRRSNRKSNAGRGG